MAVTTTNIIVGMATLYVAPITGTPPAMPAPTLAYGQAWPTGWITPGATTAGVTLSYDRKVQDITIEEQATPVDVVTDTVDISIAAILSEDTVNNMLLAYGGGSIAVTAATSVVPGYSILTLSDLITQYMVGFAATNPYSLARYIIIPQAISSAAKIDTAYRRAKAQREYSVSFRAICPQSAITIVEQTTPAT